MADFKGHPGAVERDANSDNAADFQLLDPESGVKRGLKTRHLSMYACSDFPPLVVGFFYDLSLSAQSTFIKITTLDTIFVRQLHYKELSFD